MELWKEFYKGESRRFGPKDYRKLSRLFGRVRKYRSKDGKSALLIYIPLNESNLEKLWDQFQHI